MRAWNSNRQVQLPAVSSPCAGVSSGEVIVVAMGSIATAVAIAERDCSSVSSPNNRQSSENGGDGQNVYNLLPRKGLIDQVWAALGDPRLWPSKIWSDVFCYDYYI